MFNLPSISKTMTLLAVVLLIAFGISSCASQKMGCPGSITQTEEPSASHS
jgi:hypothetical protein